MKMDHSTEVVGPIRREGGTLDKYIAYNMGKIYKEQKINGIIFI